MEKKTVVSASGIAKSFGKFQALKNISLELNEREVFGLLGPNGAGKSTLSKILTGSMNADAGKVEYYGTGLGKAYKEIKKVVGIVPQETAFYQGFSVRQNISFFGMLYGLKAEKLFERTEFLLQWLNLKKFGHRKAEHLSGGYQRLLNIACSLVNDPKIIFFDEPTVGLDPKMRKLFWEKIHELKAAGKTVCLTTHYMDEAEHLCDRIGIINKGKMIVSGKPVELIQKFGGVKVLVFVLDKIVEEGFVQGIKKIFSGSEVNVMENYLIISLSQKHSAEKMSVLTDLVTKKGYEIKSSTVKEPVLEDVFINLTGTKIRD